MINLAKLLCEDSLICDVFIYRMPLQCNVCTWSGRELPACVSLPYDSMCKCVSHTCKTHPAMSWSKLVTNQEVSLAMWVEFDTSINYRLVTARAFTVPSSVGGQEATPTCVHMTSMRSVWMYSVFGRRRFVCTCVCDWESMHGLACTCTCMDQAYSDMREWSRQVRLSIERVAVHVNRLNWRMIKNLNYSQYPRLCWLIFLKLQLLLLSLFLHFIYIWTLIF